VLHFANGATFVVAVFFPFSVFYCKLLVRSVYAGIAKAVERMLVWWVYREDGGAASAG